MPGDYKGSHLRKFFLALATSPNHAYTVRLPTREQPRASPDRWRIAGMAELVDAPDSKSGFRKEVGVRFPLPAPLITTVSGRFLISPFHRKMRDSLPRSFRASKVLPTSSQIDDLMIGVASTG